MRPSVAAVVKRRSDGDRGRREAGHGDARPRNQRQVVPNAQRLARWQRISYERVYLRSVGMGSVGVSRAAVKPGPILAVALKPGPPLSRGSARQWGARLAR